MRPRTELARALVAFEKSHTDYMAVFQAWLEARRATPRQEARVSALAIRVENARCEREQCAADLASAVRVHMHAEAPR